jgi:hypothetical protein
MYCDIVDAALSEFERFNFKGSDYSTSLRFDLHLADESVSHLRLDLDMNSETRRPGAWKLTGPRHRAAELNTFVVQT